MLHELAPKDFEKNYLTTFETQKKSIQNTKNSYKSS